MKAILLAVAVAASVLVATSLYNSSFLQSDDVEVAFNKWCMEQGKAYGNNDEKAYRKGVFANNMAEVRAHAEKNSSYRKALNKYADLTAQEFKTQYLGLKKKNTKKVVSSVKLNVNAPSEKDWSSTDAVTAVKDQGQCGSCWAFSTTGAMEGLYYLTNSSQRSFSEQQLMDCSSAEGNMSCNGGLMDNAFDYLEENGVTDESNYPYTAEDGTCDSSRITDGFKISNYVDLPNSQTALVNAVAERPVSIAINANPIQLYFDGIFDDWSCGDQIDHGVLAVGYGSEAGQDFFKVKNSWGADWGESGYFRLARRSYGEGICGCTTNASYPTA